jgi:stalled ribosome rescue protein Dom34
MPSPTNSHPVAVWLDHHEARIFRIAPESFESSSLRNHDHHVRRHPDRSTARAEHPDDVKRFFHEIVGALESANEVLVVGPSTAKLQFLRYAHAHAPGLEARIIGVETVDHPTDPQLAAYARKYFHDVDRMRGFVP